MSNVNKLMIQEMNKTKNSTESYTTEGPKQGLSNLGTFMPGTTAACISALLAVQSDMLQISNIYGELFQDQVKMVNETATITAQTDINIGNEQFAGLLSQGITSGIGGLVSGVAGVKGMKDNFGINQDQITSMQADIQGAKNYQSAINERLSNPPDISISNISGEDSPTTTIKTKPSPEKPSLERNAENDSLIADRIKKIQTQESFQNENTPLNPDTQKINETLTDKNALLLANNDEAPEVQKSLDSYIKNQEKKLSDLMQNASSRGQMISQTLNSFTTALNGAGNVGNAIAQKEVAQENAEKDLAQAAEQLANGIVSQTRNYTDQFMNSSIEVNQIVTAINQANKLN